eukprot:1030386-Rhodomonas_salina.2
MNSQYPGTPVPGTMVPGTRARAGYPVPALVYPVPRYPGTRVPGYGYRPAPNRLLSTCKIYFHCFMHEDDEITKPVP